jgi:hypothetical protein
VLAEEIEQHDKSIVAVTTDSASECVKAGKLLMKEWIAWMLRAAHLLDLPMKGIGKLEYFANIITGIRAIDNLTRRHEVTNHFFETFSDRQLLLPTNTRFAT